MKVQVFVSVQDDIYDTGSSNRFELGMATEEITIYFHDLTMDDLEDIASDLRDQIDLMKEALE